MVCVILNKLIVSQIFYLVLRFLSNYLSDKCNSIKIKKYWNDCFKRL